MSWRVRVRNNGFILFYLVIVRYMCNGLHQKIFVGYCVFFILLRTTRISKIFISVYKYMYIYICKCKYIIETREAPDVVPDVVPDVLGKLCIVYMYLPCNY